MFHEGTENKFETGINRRIPETVHRKLLSQGAGKEKSMPYPSGGNSRKKGETG